MNKIIIDGNQFEGGGSILRVAVPLAVAQGIEVTVHNIRKKRKKPGLRAQHLIGLRLVRDITNGKLEGDKIGSQKITLMPGEYSKKHHTINIPTAGAITLIMQIVQNYVSASGNQVQCSFQGGGTHTAFSPTWEEVQFVTAHYLDKFGVHLDMHRERVGFYPKGGAKGNFTITRNSVKEPPKLEEGDDFLRIYSIASNALKKARVAERQIEGFQKAFPNQEMESAVEYVEGSPGSALIAIIQRKYRKGYSQLGALGKPAEKIGSDLVRLLKEDFHRDALDCYMSDQILVPLAFAPNGTTVRIVETSHVKANLHVIDQILPETLTVRRQPDNILEIEKL